MTIITADAIPARGRSILIDAMLFIGFLMLFLYGHLTGGRSGVYVGVMAYLIFQHDWRRAGLAAIAQFVSHYAVGDHADIMTGIVPEILGGPLAGFAMALALSFLRFRSSFTRLRHVSGFLAAALLAAGFSTALDDGLALIVNPDFNLMTRASQSLMTSLAGLIGITPFLMTWLNPRPRIAIHWPSAALVVLFGIAAIGCLYLTGLELAAIAFLIAALALTTERLGIRASTLLSLTIILLLPPVASQFPLGFSPDKIGLAIASAILLAGAGVAGKVAANRDLKAFLSTQSELLCSIDLDNRIIGASGSFCRIFLGAEDASTESTRFDLLCSDPAEATRLIARARSGERVQATLPAAVGEPPRVIRWTMTPRSILDSSIVQIHGEDVTESIAAAERQATKTRRYRDIVETLELAMPCGTFHWPFGEEDPEYSDSWHRMLGHEPRPGERVTKESWRAIVHPVDLKRVQEETEMAPLLHISHHDVLHRLRHANGTWRQVRSIGKILKDENGMPYAVTGIDIDISALDQAQARATRSDTALRGGFDVLNLAFAIFDEELKLVSYNDTLLNHHPKLHDHLPLEGRPIDMLFDAFEQRDSGGDSLADVIRAADGSRHDFTCSTGGSFTAIATSLPGSQTILIEAPAPQATASPATGTAPKVV